VTLGTQITACDLYWRFPTLTWVESTSQCVLFSADDCNRNKCHDYDQATLTIHETTHVDGVYDPSTDDIAYGWPKITFVTWHSQLENMYTDFKTES
jgi:hypothetical protein